MAQVGAVLIFGEDGEPEGKLAFFMGVDKAKFRRMVVPGDQLRLEIRFLKMRMGMARVAGRVLVEGDVACEAEMMFGGGR